MTLEERALEFARKAHANQKRKYTGLDYIVHPIAVAELVRLVPHTPEMVAAAYLHDTVEDTDTTNTHIDARFGPTVAELVFWLTDISRPEDGNRALRKAIDRRHISRAPVAAKTVKIADLIDNSRSIAHYAPDFWPVYRREKMLLLDVLKDGDQTLWVKAMEQCD